MHSTTEPSTRNPCQWFAAKKCTAWIGFTALSTSGRRRIHGMPAAAMLTNHSRVAGPKTAPTLAVP